MHRFDWNNLIGEYLFRPEYSQQPVFLYLSREKLIELGKTQLPDADEQAVWADFGRAVRSYSPQNGSLLEKIETALNASFQDRMMGGQTFQTQFPPCLLLLVLSVMPLAEEAEQFKFSTTNYYQRASQFFEQHNLPSLREHNESHNWNRAWQRVADWSQEAKGGELGLFDATLLSANTYRYVGKAFAQCLLPTSALRELPNAFDRMGWVPGQLLTSDEIGEFIRKQGAGLGLKANVLAAVKLGGEVAATVEGLVRREFGRWDGTSKYSRTTVVLTTQKNPGATERQEPEFTQVSASLRFGFKLKHDYTFEPFYRLFAPQDYPEHLVFTDKKGDEWRVEESYNRWSEQIDLPFLPAGYDLADTANR
ncbi:MAG: hypothetical protein LH606_12890 [Cytophagaceae bacterium]|nr:hypothetical protein [Cytophagaceae bacterium]